MSSESRSAASEAEQALIEELREAESTWDRMARNHIEHGEHRGARLAAECSDAVRWYRAHVEAAGEEGWQA